MDEPMHPLLILAVAAAPPPQGGDVGQAVAASEFSIPFELNQGHIFVSAYVNGRGPYRFGFDTGASGIGRADSRLACELSLPHAGQAANSDGVVVSTADVVSVESLRLGALEKRNVTLIARDYNKGRAPDAAPLMGIIARDFFADRLVTIDYPKRTIRFSTGSLRADEEGVFAWSGSLTVPVCFAAGCFPGKLDTGSSRSLVIPKNLLPKIAASEPTLVGKAARTNSSATLYEIQLKEPVRIGGVTAVAQKALYAEPSDSVIDVGSDFLKDYVLTVDQAHRLVRLTMPDAIPAPARP
jgi:hypothetical protein